MKNLTLTFALTIMTAGFSWAQEFSLKDLTAFDKLVVKGRTEKIILNQGSEDHPTVRVQGVTDRSVSSELNAGTLTLTIEGGTPATLHVYNGHLKRIEASGEVKIDGGEIIGDNGKYLVVSFDKSRGGTRLTGLGEHVDVRVPVIDIDIPDVAVEVSDFDFNFDGDFEIDGDFSYDWEGHKGELKRWSEEWKEESKEVMREVQEEMKRMHKEMKRVNKD